MLIRGPPEVWPRVFSVGPGERITYGTGTRAATRAAATTPIPATSRVTVRRDMGGRLRTVDPFALTVAEYLVLPDRHGLLELVDQGAARGEGLGAVRARDGDHDGQIAHGQVARAVHGG